MKLKGEDTPPTGVITIHRDQFLKRQQQNTNPGTHPLAHSSHKMKATLKISTSYFEILYFEIGSGPKSQTDFWIHQHTSCLHSITQASINTSIASLVSTPVSWVKVMDVNLHSPHLGDFWLWKARRVVSGSGGLKLTWTPHWILVCLCLRPKDLEFTSRVRMRHGGGPWRNVKNWRPDNIYSFPQERTLVGTLLLNAGRIKGGLLLHFSVCELKQTSSPEDSSLAAERLFTLPLDLFHQHTAGHHTEASATLRLWFEGHDLRRRFLHSDALLWRC